MTETFHTADSLAERFPDLGAFVAEDIVGWHAQKGMFPDQTTLVSELGLPVELAASVAACLAVFPEAEEATMDATSLAEFVTGPEPEPEPEPAFAGMAVLPPLPSSLSADDDLPAIFSRPPVRSVAVVATPAAKPPQRSLRKVLFGARRGGQPERRGDELSRLARATQIAGRDGDDPDLRQLSSGRNATPRRPARRAAPCRPERRHGRASASSRGLSGPPCWRGPPEARRARSCGAH